MKYHLFIFSLFLLFTTACAHGPSNGPLMTTSVAESNPGRAGIFSGRGDQSPAPAETAAASDPANPYDSDYIEDSDFREDEAPEEKAGIADPLEPFNRAMYHFNDKLYFWVLKPAAQGYSKIVPEEARISVGNFFSNIAFPIRFVNCLLQANFGGATRELGRFVVNTLWGIGGLMDPASSGDLNLIKQDEDLGQTLGVYGLGQGFFINWPVLGPSSPRDTLGTVGDFFLHPLSHLSAWDVSAGIRAYDTVNDTSLKIGDYESLKDAAIDPYVAIRDAYVQYRLKKVRERGVKPASSGTGGNSLSGRKDAHRHAREGDRGAQQFAPAP